MPAHRSLVDKTVQALALVPWAIIGTSLLVYLAIDNELAKLIMLGTFLLGLGIVGFVLVQRAGMFGFIARIIGKFNTSDGWGKITHNAHDVDALVKEIYSDKKRFLTLDFLANARVLFCRPPKFGLPAIF